MGFPLFLINWINSYILIYGFRNIRLPVIGNCYNSIELPPHSAIKCDSSKYVCEVKCIQGYTFPLGEMEFFVFCSNGVWMLKSSKYLQLPACTSICNPPCKNNGICKKPGTCDCPANFFGSYCEKLKSICTSKPYFPKNSKVSCTRDRCNIECHKNFKFEDGTNFTTLECLGGKWKEAKTQRLSLSDCKPTCVPTCKNGGRCISLNTCQCLKHFKGSICQYDINVCNITNTSFNGNIQCSSNNEATVCTLRCPQPLKFDKVAAAQYKCLYSSGVFLPQPTPKCILVPGSSFLFNTKISNLQYSSKLIGYSQDYVMNSNYEQKYNNNGNMSMSWSRNNQDTYHMQTVEEISLNWNKYQREFWKHGGMYLNWNEAQQELNRLANFRDMSQQSNEFINEEKELSYENYFDISTSYSMYSTYTTSVTKVPKPGLCISWSGNNIKTFDDSIYKYSLACSHTLVEDRIDGNFHIILKGCLKNTTQCYHSIVIYWQSIEYTFQNKDGNVELKTPKKQLQIPNQIMGMRVGYIGKFIKINIDVVGISILWDVKKFISIEATAALWNKTAGLCGTFDSIKENDFLSKDGQIFQTTKLFVDTWKVTDENDDITCLDAEDNMYNWKYTVNSITEKAAKIQCRKLLTSPKILECLNLYNKSIAMAACVREYVNCPSSNGSCICEFMEMLTKTCIFQGAKLNTGWRDLDICPMHCQEDSIYMTCGPSAEVTCGNNPSAINSNICSEGCFCPKGTVRYKNKCISVELCPCSLRNKEFQNGSIIQKNCNSCVCKSGIWNCSNNACNARCSVIGNSHHETFDGKQYDFIHKCSYFLMKTENVSIIAENFGFCNSEKNIKRKRTSAINSSCLKSITINANIDSIFFSIKLQEEQVAYLNDQEIKNYPQILHNGILIIRYASSAVVKVDISKDISVWWDGISNCYIDISTKLRNKTLGLCGTFNFNIQDDFKTPERDTETSVEAFANKWKTEHCNYGISHISSNSRLHPCQQNPQNKKIAEKICSVIYNATFEDCHWAVDPEPYYEDCLFDVCNCNKDFESCYCPILSAYGIECSRQGIGTNWRNSVHKCDLICPVGQVYDECGNSCLRSCNDLSRKNTCIAHCVDGCHCPVGEYLNINNDCIVAKQCPCFFNGSNFNIGYKEVRPSQFFLELCTCVDGSWNCTQSAYGDEEKYPAAAQLKHKCNNLHFAEFVECAPIEIETCMNIYTYVSNYENCKPGCVCKKGYVFDSTTQQCILHKNCSCHHGGKSYQYGEEIKEDCNKCQCIGGSWQCTKNKCASICSVWGDSHFTTFDKREFDFQGACDYILSQGYDSNGNGFTITIQNVVCGSLGVTCSKSIKINIKGKSDATLTLSSYVKGMGKIKENYSNDSLIIYKAGVFIIIEEVYIGIQIKWDYGTRVYLKLKNTWKSKITGLCGNYNDDAKDDMKSPSFGIETSALSFGHSWKVLDYCTIPSEQIDACKEHPQRLTWAQQQCGILKSEVFQDCHPHVSFETYLKRCIFDTCACDQGGDCDCLCTAISAYAYACSSQGIYIKWRTPHLCPMQCDPLYSHYSSCTRACPVTTCNNFFEQHTVNLMCHDEQCLEGCQIKNCDKDLIYKDDTYSECISKDKCRPVCFQTADGIIYYEGNIMRSDKCQTCYCSKKKEVCSGAPCSSLPDKIPIFELPEPPLLNEHLTTSEIGVINNNCNIVQFEFKEFPDNCRKFLHCQLQPNGIWTYVEKTCAPSTMFNPKLNICDHIYNVKKIKPSCISSNIIDITREELPTKYPKEYLKLINPTTFIPESERQIIVNKCNSSIGEYNEYPGDCYKFFHCQPQIDGSWSFTEKTCGPSTMFNPKLNICDHTNNVKKIKPSCISSNVIDITREELPTKYPKEYLKLINPTTFIPESSTERQIFVNKCNISVGEYNEFPGNCYKFLHCQQQSDDSWSFTEKTCGPHMMFSPNGNICDHPFNVKKIKPACKMFEVLTAPEKILSNCSKGYSWSDCAYHCDHTCHFYKGILMKTGHCNHNSNCEEGCIKSESINCLLNEKLWRDVDSCVSVDECPCMDDNGEMIKPHAISEIIKNEKCQKCQCIDNSIACTYCKYADNTTNKTIEDSDDIVISLPTDLPLIMTTTVMQPIKCKSGRYIPIINGLEKQPDIAFSASSVLSPFFLPHYARFDTKPSNESNGSWSPLINDQMQYLEISLPYVQPIFAIIIQGSPIFDQYVTLFKILYSTDGEAFHYLIDKSEGPQIFSGPINAKTAIKSFFTIPIEAKVLRIYPLKWHVSISIRFEIFGCDNNISEEAETVSEININTYNTAMPTIIEHDYDNKPICYDDLGIEIGIIHTNYVSASSVRHRTINEKTPALVDNVKKSSLVGWRPALDSPNEFISFDFKHPRNITGIRTLGGSEGWVTAFSLFYCNDGHTWNKILNSDGLTKIFIGNHDKATPKVNYFKYPIRAQYLKLVPLKWKHTINLRIEPLGCLEPYTEKMENITDLEISQICLVCPDIENTQPISDDEKCICIPPFFWNGDKCIDRNECSCVDNHIKYAAGVKFENKECMNCVCILGGIQQCKPKICPPCKTGQRQVHSKTCMCSCESCPEFQKLCPSSGDCIPESLWCNGVQDCEDDENEDCSENMNAINNNFILNITKKCPEISCPTGMEIMYISNSEMTLSAMFHSITTVNKQFVDDTNISVTNMAMEQHKNSVANSDMNVEILQEHNCLEFVCKPKQSSFSDEKTECNNFKCPENYEIHTEFDDIKSTSCPTYTCKRLPKKDDICYIVGNIFKTFDGTEYKYEVCSHILVRDIGQNKWNIKVYRNCSIGYPTCTKEIKIEDKVSNIILSIQHNLKLMLHGYQYSARQLENSNLLRSVFIISQPGETILIVSKKHGFWISFNSKNEIKIGVSSKFINTVDGLCGYYNGKQTDDKRLPNGDIADSTFKFGESWSTKEVLPKYCQSWVCPKKIQENALKICMNIKNDFLLKHCAKALNFKQFIPICVEKICDCMKSRKDQENNISEYCKCSLLQSFVTDCLTKNPDLDLDTWRFYHKCEINCKPPFIYKDCYKKRCEQSCDSTQKCPVLPNVCFPGCFCPQGTVKKDNSCIPITDCKNCVCKNIGLSNFITYDKKNLTIKHNCNYLISRDKKLSSGDYHNFQIFGSHECTDQSKVNCFHVLHLIASENIVSLKTYTNSSRKLLVNGEETDANKYFSNSFISIQNSNENLIINMIEPQVEILSRLNDLSFSISVSSFKYQGLLEGVCGNCNGELNNYFDVNVGNMEISTILKTHPQLMIHEKVMKLDEIDCEQSIKTSSNNCVSRHNSSCLTLLDQDLFGQCHNLVDTTMYLSTCQQDLCSERTACASISAYARECINNGICIDWRRADFCPYECPSYLQYNACSCPKKCADFHTEYIFHVTNTTDKAKKQITHCPHKITEGCFCPSGKMQHGNKCVLEQQCIKCDGEDHYYGEIWYKNKCTHCKCNRLGIVECTQKVCQIEETICEQGFKKESTTSEEDCCSTFVCVPHRPMEITLTCPKPSFPKCLPQQQQIQTADSNGCPKYICECSTSLKCKENIITQPLNPGEKVITEIVNCCPVNKIVCDKLLCAPKALKCENKFYELVENTKSNSCCAVYECVLSQNVCLVEINKEATIKQIGEKWDSPNLCTYNVCSYGLNTKAEIIQQNEICSNTKCEKDSRYIVDSGECCGKCVQTMCEYAGILYNPGDKWFSDDKCTIFSCIAMDNKTVVSSVTETCPNINDCPDNMKILQGCCMMCNIAPISLKICDTISIPKSKTVGLVETFKINHGICVNKKPISGFKECAGNCLSGTKYKREINKFKLYCECCSVENYQTLNITLTCSDGFEMTINVDVPSVCGCKHCATIK